LRISAKGKRKRIKGREAVKKNQGNGLMPGKPLSAKIYARTGILM